MSKKLTQEVPKAYEEIYFVDTTKAVWNYSLLSDEAIHDFQQGKNYTLYYTFGSKQLTINNTTGFYFSVWAPNATSISVIGDFNGWTNHAHELLVRQDGSGIWEGFIPNFPLGGLYKYHIVSANGLSFDKGDPFANRWQLRPNTSSIAHHFNYEWSDAKWMKERKKYNGLESAWSVYELHLGSWKKPNAADEDSFYNYRDIATDLVLYITEMGFTHVEFMPLTEFPFDGSWGYQCTGYFAATARFGTPEDLMYLIDQLHQHNIGIIMDWVPSHFPYDSHGLYMFDGTHLYEYANMKKGYHPDWKSYIFNYERGEVKSFLISSARFWFELFHVDGLRVDAVSSMIYLNYSREEGEWDPNKFGGDGNLEALEFVKDLNKAIYLDFKDVQMIAEEATNYQWVAKPLEDGGLGFGMKWMMGWMNDTLKYFSYDPLFRGANLNMMTFSIMYAFNENYMMPFSHDEVVHGKSPMLYKMQGDEWQKFANLRLLYAYMFTHPGAKLLFMGNEFAQTSEWNYKSQLDWHLLQFEPHQKMQQLIKDLNKLYKTELALTQNQFSPDGFEWIKIGDPSESLLIYRRKGKETADDLVVAINLTSQPKLDYEIELYGKAKWEEILNTDHKDYWGAGDVYNPAINCSIVDKKNKLYKIKLQIPPLGVVVIK
jgi:1,4-alpha-glucan branching enzyme